MSDGTVGIMLLINENSSVEACIAQWHESEKSKVISHREISEQDLPTTREFRDAWCDVTDLPTIDIDLTKAKEIQLTRLRFARNELLAKTDVDMLRATEIGNVDEINQLKQQRQALRDVTEPLKQLKVSGYNDNEILNTIKRLGTI